jgi:hypothetical protein
VSVEERRLSPLLEKNASKHPEQGSDIDKEVTASFATPGKSQLRRQDITAADDSDGTEKLLYPHRL